MTVPARTLTELKVDIDRLLHQLSRSNSKDEALENAIKAAETSMQAMKLTSDPSDKSTLSARLRSLLKQAESIKAGADWRQEVPSSSTTAERGCTAGSRATAVPLRVLEEPVSTRELTRREKILLLQAGFLHGFKFPPWASTPGLNEFELKDGEELFLDTKDLPLSEFQEDVLDDWKRPIDALPPPSWFPGERDNLRPTMSATRKTDLVQDAATDCSVVASLCATVSRLERGFGKISKSLLCPFDMENDNPVISKNGKYVCRLNFNGCYRKVVIDDRLPTSSTKQVIHVVDRQNPALLWPALIEKAYLKVRGGYDFPGSNSGTDLWVLTGWIPEQVFLQADDLEPDRLWRRIANSFSYGDVLITMGTGKMSSRTERELGLAGEHDYAVLDLREMDGQRLMLIKNPWCEGTSWLGKKNQSHKVPANDGPFDSSDDDEPLQSSRDLLNADDRLSPGTFWMDFANVMQYFESIYLNWNTGLFKFRQDLHFSWDLSACGVGSAVPRGPFASLVRHPQFTVSAQSGGTIWVLLCRHFQNAVPADATPEEIEEDRYGIELKGHMSLVPFSSNGQRVFLPDKALGPRWFVDSPQTLLKLEDCEPGEKYTLVPAEQELPAINHTLTLSAFSNSAITLAEAKARYPFSNRLSGAWIKENAGGNAHYPSYSTNPQYSIHVAQDTSISILLEATNGDLNVHVKLVYSKGKRMHSIRNRDIVFDSGDYRRGCCVAERQSLDAGRYSIICSTFEPQQLGHFTLLIESSQPTQIVLLPREGAGMVRLELGSAKFELGQTRVAAPLVPRRLAKFYAIARHKGSRKPSSATQASSSLSRSHIRLSIEIGKFPDTRVLIASSEGEYSDSAGAIRINDIDLGPDTMRFGEIWLVLDRIYASPEGFEEQYSVDLFVDQLDAIDFGTWRSWDI